MLDSYIPPIYPQILFQLQKGALILRTRFWGPLFYNIKEPQTSIGNYLGPYISRPLAGARIVYTFVSRPRPTPVSFGRTQVSVTSAARVKTHVLGVCFGLKGGRFSL